MKNSVFQFVKVFDIFSQIVQFRTSRTQSTFRSVIGAVFSFAVLALTIPYFLDKYTILTQKLDQTISTELAENVFEETEPIKMIVGETPNEQGYNFQLATVFTDLNTFQPFEEYDRLFTPQFFRREFDYDTSTETFTDNFTNLTTNNCTNKNFEVLGEKAKQELDQIFPTTFQEKSICLDQGQDVSVEGRASSNHGARISILFMPCVNTTTNQRCFSKEERIQKL